MRLLFSPSILHRNAWCGLRRPITDSERLAYTYSYSPGGTYTGLKYVFLEYLFLSFIQLKLERAGTCFSFHNFQLLMMKNTYLYGKSLKFNYQAK